jgi:hypothetical protein
VLDVHIESFAFQKKLQIGIVLERRVYRGLVKHLLKSSSSALNKIAVEATDSLLLRRRWNHNSRVVAMESRVKPEKIAISALDFELGLLISLGSGLFLRVSA